MSTKSSTSSARTTRLKTSHLLNPAAVSKVLCHRRREEREQYLVRWKTEPEFPVPPRAVCSWHNLEELARCLHLVQKYLEILSQPNDANSAPKISKEAQLPLPNRKRKAPGAEPVISRDGSLGILTPQSLAHFGRSSSAVSISSSSDATDTDISVYNGTLEKKEGWIVAKRTRSSNAPKINATTLPIQEMREEASKTSVTEAEDMIRHAFEAKLRRVPKLYLEKNDIDKSAPSLNFTFIKEYVLGDGVYRADEETYEGCQKPCQPNMGQRVGCEYPRLCTCLEYAAVNEQSLQASDPKKYEEYMRQKANNEVIDTIGLPKRFPYQKPNDDPRMPQTLVTFYRESRHPIYECNRNCNCGPICKSRVAQKGRRVPLTIFKTPNRGWGVYCNEDLIQGEFIDTYLGEIITNEEADRREARAGTKDKASYLYSLDKFVGDAEDLTIDSCYIVDGQYMGGPTRFINHSCEPNCRQYTVSYNKHDLRIYDLAFFAIEDIPAGMELAFDYMDKDEEEEEEVVRKKEEAAKDPENVDKVPCNCGAKKCRGLLWV